MVPEAVAAVASRVAAVSQNLSSQPEHYNPLLLESHLLKKIMEAHAEMAAAVASAVAEGAPKPVLEIEAKLGFLALKTLPDSRINIGVGVKGEMMLDDSRVMFNSTVASVFDRFKNLFNRLVGSGKLTRYHKKSIDRKFELRPGGPKARASFDIDPVRGLASRPSSVIRKKRLGDIDVWCPSAGFDLRISTSSETALPPETVSEATQFVARDRREKERRTYTFGAWRIDLTEVKYASGNVCRELEVEIVDTDLLSDAIAAFITFEFRSDTSPFDARLREGVPLPPEVVKQRRA